MGASHFTTAYILLALLVFGCGVSFAEPYHRCIHDLISTYQPILRLPKQIPDTQKDWVSYMPVERKWKPIRILISMKSLETEGEHCNTEGQKIKMLLPYANESDTEFTCTKEDIITEEKKAILKDTIFSEAVKLHTERLYVQRLNEGLEVPTFDQSTTCGKFTIPDEHKNGKKIKDHDMVIYVSSIPTKGYVRSWALPCATLYSHSRPFVGVLNFAPKYITNTRYNVRVAAHEIAHILGFSFGLMYYDYNMISTNMSIRGKPTHPADLLVPAVISPNTKFAARDHYKCGNVTGMELEDEAPWKRDRNALRVKDDDSESEGEATEGNARPPLTIPASYSHWKRRNAKEELMAGIVGLGYYTNLTLAAFDDMPFYRVDYSKAENMSWGRGLGCEFVNKSCVKNGQTKYPDMFCTDLAERLTSESYKCTSDRMALGHCSLKTRQTDIPKQFQYFKKKNVGGFQLSMMDYCPFIVPHKTMWCDSGNKSQIPGSVLGTNSRCVVGKYLKAGTVPIGDVCADVRCTNNGTFGIRFYESSIWYSCEAFRFFKITSSQLSGYIQCPSFEQACFNMPLVDKIFVTLKTPEYGEPIKKEEETKPPTRLRPAQKEKAEKTNGNKPAETDGKNSADTDDEEPGNTSTVPPNTSEHPNSPKSAVTAVSVTVPVLSLLIGIIAHTL